MKNWFAYILIMVLGAVLGGVTVRCCTRPHISGPPVEVGRDTVVVVDTLYSQMPVPELEVVIDNSITIVEEDIDTSAAGDLILPRTQKLYRGEGYEARVSGYQPRLDDIRILRKSSLETVYRTSYIAAPDRPWSLALSGALMLSDFKEGMNFTPSVSVELGYDRKWWGVSAMAGYEYMNRGSDGTSSFSPFAGIELRLNLLAW